MAIDKHSSLCVMTAKGHSSRLPGKNAKRLLGKPLFSYGLEAALAAGCFTDIYISTDDEQIAALSMKIDTIQVDIRPDIMRGDQYSADQVTAELVQRLGGEDVYDSVCLINPCCPLVQPFHLRDALKIFAASREAEMIASVTKAKYDPRYYYVLDGGCLIKNWREKRIQSNRNKPMFLGNGAFNIIRTGALLRHQTVFVTPIIPYVMDELYAFDVDTQSEFDRTVRQMKILRTLAAGLLGDE